MHPETTSVVENELKHEIEFAEVFAETPLKTEYAQIGDTESLGTLGIGSFCFGLFLIPFSLILLWVNEKKLVSFAKVITQARNEARIINPNKPTETNDYCLVQTVGETENPDAIAD